MRLCRGKSKYVMTLVHLRQDLRLRVLNNAGSGSVLRFAQRSKESLLERTAETLSDRNVGARLRENYSAVDFGDARQRMAASKTNATFVAARKAVWCYRCSGRQLMLRQPVAQVFASPRSGTYSTVHIR